MNYEEIFGSALAGLHREGRYRVFTDLERQAGRFPHATHHTPAGTRPVTVWCSNDYLGMGQNPAVLGRHARGAGPLRRRGRRHPQHLGHQPLPRAAGARARRPPRARKRPCSSPPATSRTGRRSAPSGASCPAASILSDAGNHASMIEGIKASRAERHIFRHNDPEDLDRKLAPGRPGPPEARGLRIGLLDGRRHRPDRGDLRRGRGARRADLPRRGPRGRPLRRARRRHLGARRPRPPPRRHRGHARQGLRRSMAATSPARPSSCDFVRSFASGFIFTTSLPPAGGGGCRGQHPPPQGQRGRARPRIRSGPPRCAARLDAAGIPYLPNDSHIVPVMVCDPVPVQGDQRHPARRVRHLRPADQLSHRPARHRAPAHHPVAPALGCGHRPPGRRAQRDLGPDGRAARGRRVGSAREGALPAPLAGRGLRTRRRARMVPSP